ncbi:HK97-gp10 family putative phage morphogenesis protein [Propionibacteriaceae bacterium Y1700]|uniref:HK97-gp10 family putative phage morphogenesis protein n=1 Tax=Microlunatus sp. Y1700 TaxID=3418487 RepID=UPI003DA73C8B
MASDLSELYALAADLGKASAGVTRKASAIVTKAAYDVQAQAQALAPVDTGALRSSISTDVQTLAAEVGPTVNYGAHLEYGTSRMAPRPYMGPALDAVEPGFTEAMAELTEEML